MNAPSFNRVIGHCVNTLPDSLRERIDLLHALHHVMPPDHPMRERVHLLCVQIEAHQQNQLSLALDFKAAAQASNATGGHPKGKSK